MSRHHGNRRLEVELLEAESRANKMAEDLRRAQETIHTKKLIIDEQRKMIQWLQNDKEVWRKRYYEVNEVLSEDRKEREKTWEDTAKEKGAEL